MKTRRKSENDLEVTEDSLTFVVNKLCQISRESTLDHAIRVGSLVIHYFYNGDTKIWRSRGPKTQSFRRLASHPQLPMSASALYRCVAVFELCERVDAVARWTRLTASHLCAVLPLEEREQVRLMTAANAERWSVDRLEQEARKVAPDPTRRRGRPAATGIVRVTRSVEKLLRSGSLLLESLAEIEESLGGEQYSSVEQTIQQAMRGLEEARDALRSRLQDRPTATDKQIAREAGTPAGWQEARG